MNGEQIKNKIPQIRSTLFLTGLFLEVLFVLIDKSRLSNPYTGVCFRATFLLFLTAMLLEEHSKKEWILMVAVLLFTFFCYRWTGKNDLLRAAVFVFASKTVPLRKSLLLLFQETLAGCLLIVFLSLTGLFGERSVTTVFRTGGEMQTRYSLGFGHPNALHCMFYMLLLMGMYLYDDRMKLYHYLLLLVANGGVYALTNSRTSFLLGILSVLFAMLLHYRRRAWMYAAGAVLVLIDVAFSVECAYMSFLWRGLPGSPFFIRADQVLNGRIANLYYGTEAHAGYIESWSLFSSPRANEYFDMGWVRFFYWYGIIPGILAVLLILYLLYRCQQERDFQALMLVVSCCTYTVIEAHLVSVYIGRNFCLLFIGAYCLGARGQAKGKEKGIPGAGAGTEERIGAPR